MTFQDIQTKINTNKALDFGNIFNKSIDLFKKSWIQGFLMQIFLVIIALPIIIVMYIPLLMLFIGQSQNGDINPEDFNALFAGFSFLFMLFILAAALFISVIQFAMYASFFKVLKALDHNEPVKTFDLFYYVKWRYFTRIFLLYLITTLISIIAALLCYLPLFYVLIPLTFVMFVFAFNPDLNVSDIVKLSFNIGTKKWLLTFGLVVVSFLLILVLIVISCGIGIFFLMPFLYHPYYYIYKEVIGFSNQDEIQQIGDK